MEKQFVITGDTPHIAIEAQGELILKGWDEARLQVKNSAAEHITIEQDGDNVLVRCASNCSIRLPERSSVHIRAAMASVTIKNLEGALTIDQANGDLLIKSVGTTQIGEVKGDLVAKNIFGDLHSGDVRGNATVRDVQGDCTFGHVYGNFQLDDVDGEASAEVNGNALLRFDPLPGNEYRFSAHGNLQLALPKDASVRVKAACKGQLLVNLPDTNLNQTVSAPQEFVLGEGEASIELSANGNVQVFSQAPDWGMSDFGAAMADMGEDFGRAGEDIAQQVSQQIEAQMEMVAQQIEAQMVGLTASLGTMGMSEEQRQRIEERARQASERAAARAQEKMRMAQERMERKMEALQRRAEQRANAAQRRGMPRSPVPPMPPMPFRAKVNDEPVSEDERMTVLRMLEQNKITLEQADQLLAALEGKS